MLVQTTVDVLDKYVFVNLSKSNALNLIESLARQIRENDCNVGRQELRITYGSETGKLFTIFVVDEV